MHAATSELSRFVQTDAHVQSGLTSHGHEQAVGLLPVNHATDKVGRHGQEVHLVGEVLAGLHGGDVGVHQHDLQTLLTHGLDSLGTAVIELSGLADRQTARTQNEHLAVLLQTEEVGVQGSVQRGLAALHVVHEAVEEEARVQRTSAGLGVELGGEDLLRAVDNTLVGVVVGVEEQRLPVGGQGSLVHSESVVLGGDEAVASKQVHAGHVSRAVTELHLVGASTCGESEQLVAETDTEDGNVGGDRPLQLVDGGLSHLGITGTVTEEDSVVLLAMSLQVVVEGHHRHLHLTLAQTANDVVLDTAVHSHNAGRHAGVEHARLLDGHLGHQIALVGVLDFHVLALKLNLTQHHTGLADLLGEHTGIDAKQGGNVIILEKVSVGP